MSCSVHVKFPAGNSVIVSVNGVTVPRDEIQREMQHHPADRPIAAWQRAARALVVRELLMQRARHLGLMPAPLSEDGRRETDEEALMRVLVEQEVLVPEPDEETCRRYYENNKTRFRSPDIYEAAHILFAAVPSDMAAYSQARADAEAVLENMRENSNSFASFARAYSCCPSAEQGGSLGQLTVNQVTPEFAKALEDMSPGELSAAPVATRYGFHIIRLGRKHGGRTLPFNAVAERIANYLRDSVTHCAQAQYVARLVSAARIEGIDLAGAEALRVH